MSARRALELAGADSHVSTKTLTRGWTREAAILMFDDILSELMYLLQCTEFTHPSYTHAQRWHRRTRSGWCKPSPTRTSRSRQVTLGAGRRRVISGAQDLAFDDCDSWLFVVLLQVHVPEDASEAGPGSALPGSA